MSPPHSPQSSTTAVPLHVPAQSVVHAGTSAEPLPPDNKVSPAPEDIVTLLNNNVEPPATSSKLNSARTPLPAGRVAPEKSKPNTTPDVELNCVSAKPELAPVRLTPETANWKPQLGS